VRGELERARAAQLPARAVPGGGVGLDQPREPEIGVELVDGEAPERLLAGRHAVDVVEAGAPMEPDLAAREHAGRAAPLDLEVLDLVPAVSAVRHDGLVPGEGAGADQGREDEERRRDLPGADAAGPEGHELCRARQWALAELGSAEE